MLKGSLSIGYKRMQVWQHVTSCCALFTTLHMWTVSRRLWRLFTVNIWLYISCYPYAAVYMHYMIGHVRRPWICYLAMAP